MPNHFTCNLLSLELILQPFSLPFNCYNFSMDFFFFFCTVALAVQQTHIYLFVIWDAWRVIMCLRRVSVPAFHCCIYKYICFMCIYCFIVWLILLFYCPCNLCSDGVDVFQKCFIVLNCEKIFHTKISVYVWFQWIFLITLALCFWQPIVCHLEESGERWGTSIAWMHWDSRSSLLN